jgi:mannitol-specific phosphotransferase system IIBC component
VLGTGIKASVQRAGGYLAGMVMPNIAAFIAWGLITALFIPTGWLPNAKFAALVSPIITILQPVLIGYTGGRMVHGQRGAVVGAVATMGVVVGSDVPMPLGAMIVGPLAAFLLRLFDNLVATHAGLVATPSPGSIFAYAAETPKGGWFGVFAGVVIAAGVSFVVGSMLLGFGRPAEKEARERDAAKRAAAAADRRRTPVPAGLVAAARSCLDHEDSPKVSGGDTTGVAIEP